MHSTQTTLEGSVQRKKEPKATAPHAYNKLRASTANPIALFFFVEEEEEEEAADPLAVELPKGVPLACEEFEEVEVAVGAGDVPGALTSNSELRAITWVSVVGSTNTT